MKYVYIRGRDAKGVLVNKGGFTLAVKEDHKDGNLLVAVAKCRNDKKFDKRHGRIVARLHLLTKNYIVMTLPELGALIKRLGGEPKSVEALTKELARLRN
jgi:hypothetical protein